MSTSIHHKFDADDTLLGGYIPQPSATEEPTAPTIEQLKAEYFAAKAAQQAADEELSPIIERRDDEIAHITEEILVRYDNEYSAVFDAHKDTASKFKAADEALRAALTAWGEADESNKTFDEHLGCRHTKKYVYDHDIAVAWCLLNAPVLTKTTVDKKVFEAIIPTLQPDFVTVERTVTPVIKEAK